MTDDEFLGWVSLDDERSPDVRFTHDREILSGIRNRPKNSLIYYIGNYPTEEILDKIDVYEGYLKPPNKMWDAVLNTGDPKELGSGWNSTGFEGKYKEYLATNDAAYRAAMELRARSLVRTIYVGHHSRDKRYSPARILKHFVLDYVELPIEGDESTPEQPEVSLKEFGLSDRKGEGV